MGISCSSRPSLNTEVKNIEPDIGSKHSLKSKKSRQSLFSRSSSKTLASDKALQEIVDANCHETVVCIQNEEEKCNTNVKEPRQKPKGLRLTPNDPKIAGLSELSKDLTKMMCGRMDALVASEEKTIYIYHCAEFSDSVVERIFLQQLVYPEIRELCINNNCELVTYDLQLGLRDEFCFGYILRSFSETIMKQCLSRHAFFTIFLNEKYGVYWCPTEISRQEFDEMHKNLTQEDKQFLLEWYYLEELRNPPVYLLKPVSANIVKYLSHTEEVYREGYREWEKHMIRLHHVLFQRSTVEFQNNVCKSVIHKSLEQYILSNIWPKELTFWLQRQFSEKDEETSNWSFNANFFDIAVDKVDDVARSRLAALSKRLNGRINPIQKLDIKVKWSGNGINPDETLYADYLAEFCSKYQQILLGRIEEEIQRKQEPDIRCKKSVNRGLTKTLYTDIQQQTLLCKNTGEHFYGKESLMDSIEDYIRTGHVNRSQESIKPLVLHGVEGVGKSTVMAEIAKQYCTFEDWTSAVAVLRFVGASTHCETLEQLLQSIREQLCILVGHPVLSVYEVGGWSFEDLLGKVPSEMHLVILLDGLEHLLNNKPEVGWLPKELPQNIRMVISFRTDSPWMKAIQERLPASADFVEVPPMTVDDCISIIHCHFSARNLVVPNDVESQLRENLSTPTPLHVVILTMLLLENGISMEKRVSFIGKSTEELINEGLHFLEDNFSSLYIRKIGAYLAISRYGLADSEILDILSRDNDVMECMIPYQKSLFRVVPCLLWLYMKEFLRPILLERTSQGLLVYKWRYNIVRDVVRARYRDIMPDCEQLMLSYYRGTLKCAPLNKNRPIAVGSIKAALNANKCSQNMQNDQRFNGRKLDEMPWLLYQQDLLSELANNLLSMPWLLAKLNKSGLMVALQEFDMCISKLADGPNKSSLKFVRDLLKRLAAICCQDPNQLPIQLHLRSIYGDIAVPKDLPMVRKFFNAYEENPTPLLMPSGTQTDILKGTYFLQPALDESAHVFTGFFKFRNEPDHVISVSPERGQIQVWNIRTNKAVRTLIGLQQPKDVKVCDTHKAVVLCNRELKVYNLDSGELLCTLKGVLNIRMPFFGVHDAEHTIAMARNRMYVNMMSNVTGEMVTTFKVGEDRFMDSMLTSDNGEKCVCGDAVQKPFPLLVWDLHKRKLIYDLRIQGHEFLTKVSAISKDGHYVTCACKELEDPDPTFIVVYDLQSGSLFKKWKGTYSPTGVAISPDLVVSGHEDGIVCVWDLISGSLKHQLFGHTRGPDFLRLSSNGNRCVSWDSTRRDNTIRLWDLEQGVCLGTFYSGCKISCCDISPDGSMVLVGLPGIDQILTLLPPGESPKANQESVFGDASRVGATFDVSE